MGSFEVDLVVVVCSQELAHSTCYSMDLDLVMDSVVVMTAAEALESFDFVDLALAAE